MKNKNENTNGVNTSRMESISYSAFEKGIGANFRFGFEGLTCENLHSLSNTLIRSLVYLKFYWDENGTPTAENADLFWLRELALHAKDELTQKLIEQIEIRDKIINESQNNK